MKTQSFKQSDIEQSWILVDAKDKTLGRLASTLASRLRGKHRPEYTPNADLGDYIVVINANKIIIDVTLSSSEFQNENQYVKIYSDHECLLKVGIETQINID